MTPPTGRVARRAACAVAVAACASVLPAGDAAAQDRDRPSTLGVLETLHGTWEGSGILLGRPGTFRMSWHVGGGPFVRLSFANAWLEPDGSSRPVLSAEAAYFLREESVVGVWVDDRPQRLTLAGVVTDSSFVVEWTAELEDGRTEYVVRSADTVFVRDFVSSGGVERPFAEALYHRSDGATRR